MPEWWTLAARGVAGVLLGAMALAPFRPSIPTLMVIVSAFLIVNGLFAVLGGVWGGLHTMEMEGLVYLATGTTILLARRLEYLSPIHALVICGMSAGFLQVRLATSLNSAVARTWPLVLSGVSSIVLGVMLAAYGRIDARNLAQVFGEYAVVWGELVLIAGVALRTRKPSWSMPADPGRD